MSVVNFFAQISTVIASHSIEDLVQHLVNRLVGHGTFSCAAICSYPSVCTFKSHLTTLCSVACVNNIYQSWNKSSLCAHKQIRKKTEMATLTEFARHKSCIVIEYVQSFVWIDSGSQTVCICLQEFPKLSQSYYALLECLAQDHMPFISGLEPAVFLYIMATISDGLTALGLFCTRWYSINYKRCMPHVGSGALRLGPAPFLGQRSEKMY